MELVSTIDEVAADLAVPHAELVAAFDQAAKRYIHANANPNTKRAYRGDWQLWVRFTQEKKLPLHLVSPGILAAFAKWLCELRKQPTETHPEGEPYAIKTIERRVAGVTVVLRDELGVERVPKGITEDATRVVNQHAKKLATTKVKLGRGRAAALWPDELVQLCASLERTTMVGKRDFALFLMWYYLGCRRVEVADLDHDEISEDSNGQGLAVYMPTSKTGERNPIVPHDHAAGPCPDMCPVRAYREWREAAGVVGGRAFRRVDKWGNAMARGMSGAAVGNRFTECAAAAGLGHRTGHALRVGHISAARAQGRDPEAIRRQTGHAHGSRSLAGYIEAIDKWTDNSAHGLMAGAAPAGPRGHLRPTARSFPTTGKE